MSCRIYRNTESRGVQASEDSEMLVGVEKNQFLPMENQMKSLLVKDLKFGFYCNALP